MPVVPSDAPLHLLKPLTPSKRHQKPTKKPKKGAVIIFDEAHNVESVCSDAASFDLPAALIAGCFEEVTRARGICALRMDGGGETTVTTGSGAVIDCAELHGRLEIVKV